MSNMIAEIVWYKSTVAAVKDNVQAAGLLSSAEGFLGLVFDGRVMEKEGDFIRVLKWSTYEAGKAFMASEGGQKFASLLTGTIVATKHYELRKDPTLDINPNCFEFVTVRLRHDATFDEWYADWSEGLKLVTAFDGCPYAALGEGIEDRLDCIQLQPWKTVDSHLIDFKQHPTKPAIMDKLRPVQEKYVDFEKGGMAGCHVILNEVPA